MRGGAARIRTEHPLRCPRVSNPRRQPYRLSAPSSNRASCSAPLDGRAGAGLCGWRRAPHRWRKGAGLDPHAHDAPPVFKAGPAPRWFPFRVGGWPTCRSPCLAAPSVFEAAPGAVPVDQPGVWRMASLPTRTPYSGASRFPSGARGRPGSPSVLVPKRGVEPPCPKTAGPQPTAVTFYATWARGIGASEGS